MAYTYVGAVQTAQRGIESAETGCSATSVTVEYFPEVAEYLPNYLGESVGAAVSTSASRNITIEGIVTGATGRMADTFIAAITPANDMTTFGGSGGIYLKRASEHQTNTGWRSFTNNYESRPGVS